MAPNEISPGKSPMKSRFLLIIAFILAAYMAECPEAYAHDAPPPKPAIIDVKNHGASQNKSPSENTKIIQDCIDSMQVGQTLLINGKYRILGLYIDGKNNIRISGNGCLILSGANPKAYIFELKNNIRDIQIDSLELTGENGKGIAFIGNSKDCEAYLSDHYGTRPDMNAAELETKLRIILNNSASQKSAYGQTAIGNNSGQSINNVIFKNLFIHDINIGISLNADLGGEYSNAQVIGNKICNLIGAAPGQGYGIHLAATANCIIKSNTIVNASRHSIYHAKTRNDAGSGTLIQNNTILDHRKSVANSRPPGSTGWIRAAMEICRSKSVLVERNTINACYDTCMCISRDTVQGYSCSNITVTNNQFSNRQNDSPYIVIGEQYASSDYITEGIKITDNTFKASSPGYDVQILQGKNIMFSNNNFFRTGAESNISFIRLGHDAYIFTQSDINQLTFVGNRYSGPPGNSDTVAYFIASKLSDGTSSVNINKNSLKFVSHLWCCGDNNNKNKTISNPNFVLKNKKAK
ncbi:MAG: hypothetical protein A2017_18480 [Lentisphaerae bacterium GWF2_44_16]|nr:MAG: hypothetical protein A2017_18480 [Lentisphaerae bacterium GWF2_44_16]